MSAVASELEQWRTYREAPARDDADLRDLLARLKSWKAEHDQDRANQPGPFLKLAWDAVFGDEDGRVAEAIGQIEAALGD